MSLIASIDYSSTYQTGTQVNGRVYITLTDATTGLPANGNYVPVSYQVIDNGVINNYTVGIPGQSIAIYTGLLTDTNPLNPYYVTFSVTYVGTVPAPAPSVNTCDLLINSAEPIQPESAPGAADGQIRVNATSSYLPVLYSIDQLTYQASNIFTGLAAGLVIVYAKDSNNCTAQQSANVPGLNNLLLTDPLVTLIGGNTSRWNAAFNPVVFTYRRKDFGILSVQAHPASGKALVTVNANTAAVINGDKVYLQAGAYRGVYETIGTISPNQLVIDTPYSGPATGFININRLRPYYKIITQITYFDKLSGAQNTITASNRPNNEGITRADLSNFLQSILRPADDCNYTQSNYRDDNLSASYQVAYAEEWDEGGEPKRSAFVSLSHPFYVLYAAKQLGERYGGNLAAYVPFSRVPAGAEKAKWITDFTEPAYSNGYPFDIGFIYSDDLLGRDVFCEITLLDINRRPLPGSPQTSYLLNDDGGWLLNQDGSKLVIARQSLIAIPIPQQLGLNRLLIDQNFAADVYYLNITLKYTDENAVTHTLTETQTIRVDDAVDDQSVYLRWIGLTGCWNYYRFVYNQEVSLDVQNAVIIKNYVFDWENQQGIEEVISKTAGQKIKVVAEDLAVADIKGLQSIKYSPKVQMLVNKNPVKWQTIVINTATYSEYDTRNDQAPFSLTFNLPAVNIQMQ